MSSHPLSCAEAEPLLPLVADGAVDPDSDPQLFAHLASCPACQRAVAEHDLIALALVRGARAAPAPQPARILTFPRLALAATLALAAGAVAWVAWRPHTDRAPAPIAQSPAAIPHPAQAPLTAAPTPAQAPVAAAPEVLRVRRADGSQVFLVRRGDAWVAIDPGQIDGPDAAARPNADGLQVRY